MTEQASESTMKSKEEEDKSNLVMHIVVRTDLVSDWPLGAVISQAGHATAAVINKYADHPDMKAYLGNGSAMRMVTLGCGSGDEMLKISEALEAGGYGHFMWKGMIDVAVAVINKLTHDDTEIEQPEDIVTCIATLPITGKNSVLRRLKLLK